MAIKRTLLLSLDSSKRRRLSFSTTNSSSSSSSLHWSDLFPEILELILSKLSFMHIMRFKAVCSSWRGVAESYISSSLYNPSCHPPWLLLPSQSYDPADDMDRYFRDSCCFYSLEDDKEYTLKNYLNVLFSDGHLCIGSSFGWLIFMDFKQGETLLFNPLSKTRIQLPLPFDLNVVESYQRRHLFSKAVLLSDPSHDKNWGLVIIPSDGSRFLLCRNGDWRVFDSGKSAQYTDIISCNDHLYVLRSDNSIQVWDFHDKSFPVMRREINPSDNEKLKKAIGNCRGLYSTQSYLVNSNNDLLLVVRFIGNFVNHEGEVVDESDLLSDEDTHPLICPYQTKMFHVYKLDSSKQNWVDVESLNDQVLFVGINHSMAISGKNLCQKNSIYFSDDNWCQMDEDDLYGGHDFGIFSLEDKSVKLFTCNNQGKINPPPLWIVPNPW